MVEDTSLISTEGDEEKEVATLTSVDPRENVRAPGSDVKKGEKVLETGQVLSSVGGEIGTLAFVGQKEVGAAFLVTSSHRAYDLFPRRSASFASLSLVY